MFVSDKISLLLVTIIFIAISVSTVLDLVNFLVNTIYFYNDIRYQRKQRKSQKEKA